MSYDATDQCQESPLNPDSVESLFPNGATPSNRIDNISALCSYGLSPLVVTGALRQVLLQHFADTRNILNATLRKRLERDGAWKPGSDTGIYIESLHKWRPELTESRPAILLKEQKWQWKRMGIGDVFRQDPRSGRTTFAGFWLGAHTLFALGQEGAETQILATEVLKVLLWFGAEIQRQLELHQFTPISIGAVSAVAESTENYVVPVDMAYAAQEIWWLQEEAPRLKRVEFKASDVLATY